MKQRDAKLDKALDIWMNLWLAIAVVLLAGTVFMTAAYVTGRQWFGLQWLFVEEFSNYFLVFWAYFPLAYTFKTGGHVRVTSVVRTLPRKTAILLDAITSVLALAVISYMAYVAITDLVLTAYAKHTVSAAISRMPLWIPYLIIPLGLLPFSLTMVVHIMRAWRAVVTGQAVEEAKAKEYA